MRKKKTKKKVTASEKPEKPPKGSETRPPKKWFDYQVGKRKGKKNIKDIEALVGDHWDNKMNPAQRAAARKGEVGVW